MDAAAEDRELASGTMLDDKYRIERLLAVGGMGEVYLGTHVKLRKRVAIKVLNPRLSSPPMVERFHREAITASQIGHEGIAQVTDLGTSTQGEPFLVMEYLEGESLAARIRAAAPLPVEVACELGCAILSPLEAAHRAGIVHRDLKPDNVFLVEQSRGEMVKLLDFGISRASGLDGEFRLTTTGLVLGTPFYMSPEQARGDHEITIAADLYAFGVILYEMLVGTVPIQADNYNQLMYRVMNGEFVPPRRHRPDLPEALEQLILHAMALDAGARPSSAAELEQALLAFCRPTFRDHAVERLSGPRLPRNSAVDVRGSAPAVADAHMSIERTVLATPAAISGAATAAGEPPRRRSKLPWIVVGLVAAAGIGVAAIVTFGQAGDAKPTTTTATAATEPSAPADRPSTNPSADPSADPSTEPAATGSAAAVPAVTPPPPVEAATVTITFATDPPGARISIDGTRLSGHELVVPPDDAEHRLEITAPGRIAHTATVRFDVNQRMTIQLKKQRRVARPPTGGKRGGGTKHIDPTSPYQ